MAHHVGKLLKLLARYGEPRQVQVVYEAGPTGYGLQRQPTQRGYACQVKAQSLIPKRAGNRVTPDRHDCLRLAERAGELREMDPGPEDVAIRDLAARGCGQYPHPGPASTRGFLPRAACGMRQNLVERDS
jgi:transposase